MDAPQESPSHADTIIEESLKAPLLLPNGPAAAAILAAAIGGFFLGLATTAAEAMPAVKTALTWVGPVGPLSGKTGVGLIAWIVSWLAFGIAWRRSDVRFGRIYALTLILLAIGFLGTFPIFY